MKLLIVEDHDQLRWLLGNHLQRCGFEVDFAETGCQALACLKAVRYDALILDLGLPDMDGGQILTARRVGGLHIPPCIVLTARDALQSKLDTLNAGADDYVLKPVDIAELEARIKAVLRRTGRAFVTLRQGNLSFEPQFRHATVDGRMLELARRETMLLEEMLRTAPRIAIKDHLEERIYGSCEAVTLNAIEALVSRLRRKLEAAGSTVRIDTVRGVGYRLVAADHNV